MKPILSAGVALALLVIPAAAAAAPALAQERAPLAELSAARKAKAPPRHVRAAPQRKIACTYFGCRPVPRGCTPVTGRDFFGNPADYDSVVCR